MEPSGPRPGEPQERGKTTDNQMEAKSGPKNIHRSILDFSIERNVIIDANYSSTIDKKVVR